MIKSNVGQTVLTDFSVLCDCDIQVLHILRQYPPSVFIVGKAKVGKIMKSDF